MKFGVCVHAHMYQPPRENPWLEAVEVQDSAHPFHDWNERITVQCYAPNGAARVVNSEGRIVKIANNYASVSFDFGPTLIHWIEQHSPDEYRRIIEGDRESFKKQNGHGNAIAMCYNHMIMPLASERDRTTQITWGLRDFEHTFGRPSEGMWLPETAVDLTTLDLLERHGVKFTILSPFQAKRILSPTDENTWIDVSGGRIDPRRPYFIRLPNNRKFAVFFYDKGISHAVAFERLLVSGEGFAQRLKGAVDTSWQSEELINIATDGESYGHHWPHGDMALAYAAERLESDPDVTLTNYGRFLAESPPIWEVEIHDNSSWSCAHGVERWRSDCGCKLDPGRNWSQAWRTPLREAFDWLREQVDRFYEQEAALLVKDPWAARDDYISVLLDRNWENLSAFCQRHEHRPMDPSQLVSFLKLLEMQRYGMFIYTSCGWFFDDVSGLEPTQNIKFACRVVQLAGDLGLSIEEPFLERLAKAKSNLPEQKDAAEVYRRHVRPAMASIRRVAAHAAMESAFNGAFEEHDIFCYHVVPRDFQRVSTGATMLTIGRMETRSIITLEADDVMFGVLAMGGHDVQCSLRASQAVQNREELKSRLIGIYQNEGLTDVVRSLDRELSDDKFTLRDLFLESRRRILENVTQEKMDQYEGVLRTLYQENQRLMQFVQEVDARVPRVFQAAAELILNRDLDTSISDFLENGNSQKLNEVLEPAHRWNIPLHLDELEPRIRERLNELIRQLIEHPDPEHARQTAGFVRQVQEMRLPLYFWQAQNLYLRLADPMAALNKNETPDAKATIEALKELGRELGFLNFG